MNMPHKINTATLQQIISKPLLRTSQLYKTTETQRYDRSYCSFVDKYRHSTTNNRKAFAQNFSAIQDYRDAEV